MPWNVFLRICISIKISLSFIFKGKSWVEYVKNLGSKANNEKSEGGLLKKKKFFSSKDRGQFN